MPAAGTKLGPYEILSAIGAGGMGEVYRARDARIGREVAIKVLPAHFSQDPERLRRFEQEARATGVLNHPNIVAVYDVGTDNGFPYLVTELLQGETLRKRLTEGRLPMRKAIDYALQTAQGLSAAHEKGIIHRDLKPENVFITKEGYVKILDFGLAKLTLPEIAESKVTEAATRSHQTGTGVVMGTALYMSPEQVRGEKVDHRSDIFAFGTILYEMISGKLPFHGDSQIEIMRAILKADPVPLSESNKTIPPALEKTIQRCLEKDPDHRFQSTSDLAFALEALSSSSGGTTAALPAEKPLRLLRILTAALLALAATAGIFYAGTKWGPKFLLSSNPTGSQTYSWTRITFRRGHVLNSNFAPDGQTILYDARWGGRFGADYSDPAEIFFSRIGSPESRSLGLKHVMLLSVSRTGQLAILLSDHAPTGTLAVLPFTGGTPRSIAENIAEADWSPEGKNLVILRAGGQLEYPIGKVLYSREGLSSPRFSPRGDRIAFIEMHQGGVGYIQTIDLSGKLQHLCQADMSRANTLPRLAWTPSGEEVWFAARSTNGIGWTLYSVNLSKQVKKILPMDGALRINDISADGRVLLTNGVQIGSMIYYPADQEPERDLSWLDNSQVADISEDGKTILFTETGEASSSAAKAVYLRNVDAEEPVRLGEGHAVGLSPNQKWALVYKPGSLILLPTGPGQSKTIRSGNNFGWASWFPDGKQILFEGKEPGHDYRLYVYRLDSGAVQQASEEGVNLLGWGVNPISADGKRVIAESKEGIIIYTLEDSKHATIPGLKATDSPIRWSKDGHSIFVDGGDIYRIDLSIGRRELWKRLTPPDRAGIHGSTPMLTADGKTIVCTFVRTLDSLYLIEGLK